MPEYDRRNWDSVLSARLERALQRSLRTLPALRYHGNCIICKRDYINGHACDCKILILLKELSKYSGKFSKKEVRHLLHRADMRKRKKAKQNADYIPTDAT